MTRELAKQIITEAINLAMTKGCYGLVENSNIIKALDFINEEPPLLELTNTSEPKEQK